MTGTRLSFWDYNDVAPGYFAAAEVAARDPLVGVMVIEVARPDFPVADHSTFADTDLKAAAKGFYVIRDFDPGTPRHGYVLAQGSSSTFNLVQALPHLEEQGINVKVVAAISEELFDRQPQAYRDAVLPAAARNDLMVVTTGTKRMWPVRDVAADHRSTRRSPTAEAHLDEQSIEAGATRFVAVRRCSRIL